MIDSANVFGATKTIEIETPEKKVSTLAVTITLMLFLLILVCSALVVGYVFGQAQLNQEKAAVILPEKITVQKNDLSSFDDPNARLKLTFPTTWQASYKDKAKKNAYFKTNDASLEYWLEIDQTVTLSQEQKAGLEKTNSISVDIAGQKAKGTEYIYQVGTYLTIIKLNASNNQPQITFLIKALDKLDYETALTIVKSLTFY